MQISRTIRQLKELGLVSVRKDGVRLVLCREESRQALFERSRPYLLNPVRKKVYVEFGGIPDRLPLSGISALSELTMLSCTAPKSVAFFGKACDLVGADMLIDNNTQAEVEEKK